MAISSAEAVPEGTQRSRTVQVTVNGEPVVLLGHRVTGLEIKEAAIAAGVLIQLDFQLSVKRGDHYDQIGDADEVEVHTGEEFLAVAPDDNS